jgi:FkbM family methyltransferase
VVDATPRRPGAASSAAGLRDEHGYAFGAGVNLHVNWIREAWDTAALGFRLYDKVRLWTFHIGTAVATTLRVSRPLSITARLSPDGRPVIITGSGELSVLRSVFVQHEYEARGEPNVIFDLGANVGFVSVFYRRAYPLARIVAVEADSRTYDRLVRNVEGLGVTTFHRAAAGSDGQVAFFSHPSSSLRSSTLQRFSGDIEERVQSSTMRTLMHDAGVERVDLLKLDIEGAEFDLLATAPLEAIAEIVGELHYDLGKVDEAHIRALLTDFELELRPLDVDPVGKRWLLHAQRRRAVERHE